MTREERLEECLCCSPCWYCRGPSTVVDANSFGDYYDHACDACSQERDGVEWVRLDNEVAT